MTRPPGASVGRLPSLFRGWNDDFGVAMSDSDATDQAVQRVRDAFDEAVNDAEQMSETARREVTEAIDDLEARIDSLRDRK